MSKAHNVIHKAKEYSLEKLKPKNKKTTKDCSCTCIVFLFLSLPYSTFKEKHSLIISLLSPMFLNGSNSMVADENKLKLKSWSQVFFLLLLIHTCERSLWMSSLWIYIYIIYCIYKLFVHTMALGSSSIIYSPGAKTRKRRRKGVLRGACAE